MPKKMEVEAPNIDEQFEEAIHNEEFDPFNLLKVHEMKKIASE